jgi:hypothetical protein
MRRGGKGCEMEVTAGVVLLVMLAGSESVLGFVRLARGEAGREGGSRVLDEAVVVGGGGVISLVIVFVRGRSGRN